MGCNYSTKTKNEHIDNMGEVWKKWTSHKSIKDRYRNSDGTLNIDLARERLVDFAQYKLKLPFDQDYVLSKGEISRLNVEIDAYSKDLKGKFSQIAGIVPEGISKQDPTSRKFYLDLNNILNMTRVNTGKKENAMASITSHFLDAYTNAGMNRKYFKVGIDAVNELRNLRQQAMEAPSPEIKRKFEQQIEKFVNGDEGFFLRQFKILNEMSSSDLKRVRKEGKYVDPITKKESLFDPNIVSAAEKSRNYLDNMGNVFVRGLEKLKDVVDQKYKYDTSTAKRLKGDIDTSIASINASIDRGGYWPGVFLQNLVDVKIGMEKMIKSKNREGVISDAQNLSNILRNIPDLPDQAKARNPNLKHVYDQDPLFVLNQYGKDAVAFNKLVFAQDSLLKAMSQIPKTNNTQFLNGLKKFLVEEYTVFTEGTRSRPDWVNNMVYYVNAFQTARTMGFNITGAAKNAASAVHYFSHVGLGAVNRTGKSYRHNEDGVRDILDNLEKRAGYKFVDPASELFSEGLIKRSDFDQGRIEFDPIKGTIKYNGSQLKDQIGEVGEWSMGKLLTFHRMTENWQRRWMFRTAFIQKYQQLLKNSTTLPKDQIERFAENHALEMVNAFAYEYAPHAKAKPLRGTGHEVKVDEFGEHIIMKRPIIGGMSEVAFHLLHYPMSLAETHLSALKGAGKAIQAGQWNADELMYAARYAGVFGVLQAGSILLNVDLNNLFENETVSRMRRVHDDLTVGGKYEISDLLNPDYTSMGELSFDEMDAGGVDTLKVSAVARDRGDRETARTDETGVTVSGTTQRPVSGAKQFFPQDFIQSGRKKSTFGLSAEIFGPTVGHMKYGLIASGLMDLEHSLFNQIVFGNVDYSKDDEETARYEAYQYSTEYGRFVNKTWPAVRDGRGMDLVRHWLGLYPRKWTKQYHESIFGLSESKQQAQARKRIRGLEPEAASAVGVLDQMLEMEYKGTGY